MPAKRQRVSLERPSQDQAALPAVCYLPSFATENGSKDASTSISSNDGKAEPLVKRLKLDSYSKQRKAGHAIELVHGILGDIDYVGRSDNSENSGPQPCSYALGVYNPVEGKLRLVPVAGDRVFRLDPRLADLVYEPTGAGLDPNEVRRDANKRLVDEFGSTRRRRQISAREAGVVTAERIAGGTAVHEMLGSVATKGEGEGITREEINRRAFAHRTIPPHDPAATTATAAYPLHLLLGRNPSAPAGEGEADDLVSELNTKQIHKLAEDPDELAVAKEKKLLSPYVLSRIRLLRSMRGAPAMLPRAKMLAKHLALLALLLRLQPRKFLALKDAGLSGLARDLKVRDNLLEFVLERFYGRSEDPVRGVRYSRTGAQSQLLLAYILAVAVAAENGFMDSEQFEALRTELELDAAKVVAALHELGCTVKPVKLRTERDGRSGEMTGYTVGLLNDGKGKKLEEVFPAFKTRGKPKGGGR